MIGDILPYPWIGMKGILKSFYYSHRHTDSITSLFFHSNVITNISQNCTFDIGNRLSVGIVNYPASHPKLARSVFTTKPESSVTHSGTASATIGPGSVVYIDGDYSMGDSYINSHCRIICGNEITIGDNVAIAWNVELVDDDRHQFAGSEQTAPIIIKDNVWIGHNVTIKKGTTVNKGAVIASNSVVTSDIPSRTLVAGSPAKIIKSDIEWGK